MTPSELAARIDYPLLDATATADAVRAACDVANQYQFAAVCVRGYWARLAAARLGKDSMARTCAVVGWPDGVQTASERGLAARLAVNDGATEIEVMLNLGAAKSGDWKAVGDDLSYVVKQARQAADAGVLVKLIIPCAYLSTDEQTQAVGAAATAGADYVVAAMQAGPIDATAVKRLRASLPPNIKLRADGATNLSDALALLNAGAYRLGSVVGGQIVDEARAMVANG